MYKQGLRAMGVTGVIVCILYGTSLFAEGPDTLWTKIYGGTDYDVSFSVQETTDGGYILTGYTRSFGAGLSDVWLIKTDANGDSLWTRTYGGTDQDYGNSVQETTDGGYIIAGTTYSFGAGAADVYLIKTDANGDTLWTKTYGGTDYDEGWSVQETTDGGYIIAGLTNSFSGGFGSDVWLIKTNANGDTLWTRIYGLLSGGCEWGRSVQQTMDGGFIIAGYTESFGAGGEDVYLIKTDVQGDTLWTKTYGGTDDESAYSVRKTSDGGYILAGRTRSFGAGSYDVYLIKTDMNGDSLWTRTYGGTANDVGWSVQQTMDGGCIITGYTESFGAGAADVYLIKTDAQGDTLWTRTYGGTNYERGLSIQQVTDGGYIVAGYTESFGAGLSDVWLLRISGEPGIKEVEDDVITASYALCQNCPNPFKTETEIHYQLPQPNTVSIAIYNISGQRIKTLVNGHVDAGYYTVHWGGRSQDGKTVSNGVYFCRMQAGEYTSVKKILLMR